MPTYEVSPSFKREHAKLSPALKRRFADAVRRLVAELERDPPRLPGMPVVRPLSGRRGVYELRFAPDGRATFHVGEELTPGVPHVVWRRIGDHSILDRP